MSWQSKALKHNLKEVFSSAYLYVLSFAFVSIWYFYLDRPFVWEWIEPIDAPSFFERAFYSALVFAGPGYLLYKTKVYLILYQLFDFRTFKEIKSTIWGVLILVMYFWIIPKFVDLLNAIISIFFNLYKLVLYVAPSFTVASLVMILYLHFRKK